MHSFKQHILFILAIDFLHVKVLNGICILVQSTTGTERSFKAMAALSVALKHISALSKDLQP